MNNLTDVPVFAYAPLGRGAEEGMPRAALGASAAPRAFIAGTENRLAAVALSRVLASLAPPDADLAGIVSESITNQRGDAAAAPVSTSISSPCPLVLLGPPGSGKTHLAGGLVERCRQWYGAETAEYVTARDYRERLAAAVNERQVPLFRDRMRSLRILAIDDIHRFGEHDSWQQDLVHTIDALAENGGTLVVTSSRPLASMDHLLPAILSRLQMGLLISLCPPEAEARLALIRQAAAALDRQITDEAARLLAENIEGTPRELLGTVACLASSATADRAIDVPQTAALIEERTVKAKPELQQIIAIVSRYYSLSQKVLRSASRKKSAVGARALVIYLARQMAGLSYQAIGRDLGGRDHTTIMHSYRQVQQRLDREPALRGAVADLQRILLCP